MLSNAYFLAKFRFDTAENEPAKNLQNFRKMHFRKMHVRKMHFEKCIFRKMHFRKMHFRKMHFRKMHFRKMHFRRRAVVQVRSLKAELANAVESPFASVPDQFIRCLLYTSPSPRDKRQSRMPSSA